MVKHIVSFSGGKDSTTMLIRMLELGMKVDRIIFADTKYEFPEMYEYIDRVNRYIKRYGDYEIEVLKTDDTLEKWILGKVTRGKAKGEVRGFPLIAYPCYWSRESKFKILDKEMKGHIRYIGIAVDEKRRVVKDYKEKGYVYPLIDWGYTEGDCIKYLQSKGLHNNLYDIFDRLGCWWCPKQSIKALKALRGNYPDKWEKLKQLDQEIMGINPNRKFRIDLSVCELEQKFSSEDKDIDG